MQDQNNNFNPFNVKNARRPAQEAGDFAFIQMNSTAEAVFTIANLMQFDGRIKNQGFSAAYGELTAVVGLNQYAVIGLPYTSVEGEIGMTNIAAITWANLNPATLALYAKEIRPLAPPEYNSGSDLVLLNLFSPFGFQEEIVEFLRTKHEIFAKDSKVLSLDLFEKIPHTLG